MTTRRIFVLVLSMAAFSACTYNPKIDANGFTCQINGDCPPTYSCVKAAGQTVGVCCNHADAAACFSSAKDAASDPPRVSPDSRASDLISPDLARLDRATPDAGNPATADAPSDPVAISPDLRATDSLLPDLARQDLATPNAPDASAPGVPDVTTPDAPMTADMADAAGDTAKPADVALLPDVSQADVSILDGDALGTGGAGGGSTGSGGAGGGGGMVTTGGTSGSIADASPVDTTPACVPETDSAMCLRLQAACGPLATATDNCGQSRSVTSCGLCPATETCGAVTANVCGNSNWWGTGEDGDFVSSGTSADQFVVPSRIGPYDGDMVVKNFKSLTIQQGHTVTTDQPCRGLLVYVLGDATIDGTLSMTARGAAADPNVPGGSDGNPVSPTGLQVVRVSMFDSGTAVNPNQRFFGTGVAAIEAELNQLTPAGRLQIVTFALEGAPGGATCNLRDGSEDGGLGRTGGGGGGGCYGTPGGRGGAGTVFSGGSGGSGSNGNGVPGEDGAPFGGKGGDSRLFQSGTDPCTWISGAGAGNPAGTGACGTWGFVYAQNGTGGLLLLFVRGTLTIGAAGTISADGVAGGMGKVGDQPPRGAVAGGGSGGGSIGIWYGTAISNQGSLSAAGGPPPTEGVTVPPGPEANGGGKGSIQGPFKIDL